LPWLLTVLSAAAFSGMISELAKKRQRISLLPHIAFSLGFLSLGLDSLQAGP
jgi:hypothetical protein